jgi:hypothetical protein
MLNNFEGTTIEKDDDGLLWVCDQFGNHACEAFYKCDDETMEEMLDAGYILVPYKFEGDDVFVEVAHED